jgi:hypothetical protein
MRWIAKCSHLQPTFSVADTYEVNILKETIPTIGKIVLYKAELDETY